MKAFWLDKLACNAKVDCSSACIVTMQKPLCYLLGQSVLCCSSYQIVIAVYSYVAVLANLVSYLEQFCLKLANVCIALYRVSAQGPVKLNCSSLHEQLDMHAQAT